MESGIWYVVRAEKDGRVWQSAFDTFDDAKEYVDELWKQFKDARKEEPDMRFHVFIDQERGLRPADGEFPKPQ